MIPALFAAAVLVVVLVGVGTASTKPSRRQRSSGRRPATPEQRATVTMQAPDPLRTGGLQRPVLPASRR